MSGLLEDWEEDEEHGRVRSLGDSGNLGQREGKGRENEEVLVLACLEEIKDLRDARGCSGRLKYKTWVIVKV